MIELNQVLQQIEKELQYAQQQQNEMSIGQHIAAIKALCELVLQTSSLPAHHMSKSTIPTETPLSEATNHMMQAAPIQTDLLDF